jgi:hypothetical protein
VGSTPVLMSPLHAAIYGAGSPGRAWATPQVPSRSQMDAGTLVTFLIEAEVDLTETNSEGKSFFEYFFGNGETGLTFQQRRNCSADCY